MNDALAAHEACFCSRITCPIPVPSNVAVSMFSALVQLVFLISRMLSKY